jgi:peptidoglycan/xylan/chitin deacetylase (PgdA/CDA1 family)
VVCSADNSEAMGIELRGPGPRRQRIGFNLFQEVQHLLTLGQPVENAHVPALDLHIALLRNLILNAGIPVLEIPPVPAGYDFAVCLTHDIDFVGIRRHKLDHTMWGFLYRSTAGAVADFVRGRCSMGRLLRAWKAALSLPFVYLGWVEDFWVMFDWYLEVEKGLSGTYFFIPFKRRSGDKVSAAHPERRASAYDIGDIPDWVARLIETGCEIGVHGIDAWHSVDKGREELNRVASVAGQREMGIRMHWLLRDENTFRVLEQAGYSYDSTAGYNETPGYQSGTAQVFQPLSARKLLELPMHIQDGALFFSNRLALSEAEAWRRCEAFIANAQQLGGVLTLLWHDRSPGPERFWGEFYRRLVGELKTRDVWFGSAGQVVSWFRNRREVRFERIPGAGGILRVRACGARQSGAPAMRIRVHRPGAGRNCDDPATVAVARIIELAWDGGEDLDLGPDLGIIKNHIAGALAVSARQE